MSNPLIPETRTQQSPSEGLFTQAARAAAAFFVVGGMLAAMWVIEFFDFGTDGSLEKYGVRAQEPSELPQIFTAPFLHDDFGHIMANSLPFLVLGFLAAVRGIGKFAGANLIIILVGGLGVWFLGSTTAETLGASILVFGYFGYLLGRGVFERKLVDIVIAIVVVAIYGTMILGVLPNDPRISWQGHLFGMIGGVLGAWLLRRRTA